MIVPGVVKLRRALASLRKQDSVRARGRVFAAGKVFLDLMKDGKTDFVESCFKGLAAELSAALGTFRRRLPLQDAKGNGCGSKALGARGADHLGVRNAGRGHGTKRGTRSLKGKTQAEGAGV